MSIWNRILGWMYDESTGAITSNEDSNSASSIHVGCAINPATGLVMVNHDCGGFDVGGSPFGVDIYSNQFDSISQSACDDA